MNQVRHCRLDLLHKGIYPAIAIALTVFTGAFMVYTYWSNNEKQRQIDRLQAEVESVKVQQLAAVKELQAQRQRAEEDVHKIRVDLLRRVLSEGPNISNSPEESKADNHVRAFCALLAARLKLEDRNNLGEEKTNELWDKARKQAEKEVNSGKFSWFI